MARSIDDFISDPDIPTPPKSQLPKPMLWRILVRPYIYHKKSKGGVIIPETIADQLALENITAEIIWIGDHCWTDHQTGRKWDPPVDLREGDIVTIAKFAGQKVQIDKVYMYIINCEEVTGLFPRDA